MSYTAAQINFGGVGLSGSIATFGGSGAICNYMSPLARKWVYKDTTAIRPLRRHVFRLKVRTATELRFFEITKRYMSEKLTGKHGRYFSNITNNQSLPHFGTIIPKDEYEVKKLTSYITSQKMSNDYKQELQRTWQHFSFLVHSVNFVGNAEHSSSQNTRLGTEEEWMTWFWIVILSTTTFMFMVTLLVWWWKWGQKPQYTEFK